jgi:hypothetical protein
LLSRISNNNRYLYFYDNNGNLKRITLEILIKEKWVLCEETLIDRRNILQNKTMLLVTLNKLRTSGSRKDSTDIYFNIEYTINKDNNIIGKRINT